VQDLGVACRQNVFPEYVIPKLLDVLENDPEAGELYEGELAACLDAINKRFWASHPLLRSRAAAVLGEVIPHLSWDEARRRAKDLLGQLTTT
jgi:hypothetical protein